MSDSTSRLVISVDLDEWYHVRWATGSANSRWEEPAAFFKEVYGLDRCRGDIERPTNEILDLFDSQNVRATFFILGEVGHAYPHLVREIGNRKHEIASHSFRHIDLWMHTRESFQRELRDAKSVLEDLSGQQVVGFRAPNLVIEDWIVPILREEGFLYDSSVCPSRKLMGKFKNSRELPSIPYRLSADSFIPGEGSMIEIPIPTFPYLRLPAATGIATRVIGRPWTSVALRSSLRAGDSLYYFHPYELTLPPAIGGLTAYQKLFMRRTGSWMLRSVKNLLSEFSGVRKATCREVARSFERAPL
ncbi:MAG: polysaccharide deacetylase family protein [Ignavibacteriales bacterium]|nr:polysaccharide deacetylase family protein [Ignavibacteriales bacterium]